MTEASNTFGPLGFCMYCKRRDLPEGMKRFTDEHVLPRSLGGKVLLKQASCSDCASIINGEFETIIAKEVMGDARHKHGAPSRHRKQGRGAPTTKLVRSKWGWQFEVPLSEYPVAFPIYDFGTATLLTGGPDPYLGGNGWWLALMQNEDIFNEAHKAFAKKYPMWDGKVQVISRPEQFARLAAKVAYGTAVCHLGLDAFDEEITPVILGHQPIFSRSVGGGQEGYRNEAASGPGFAFKVFPLDGMRFRLVMDYQMFPNEKNPKYHIVLGTMDLSKPSHSEAFARGFQALPVSEVVPA